MDKIIATILLPIGLILVLQLAAGGPAPRHRAEKLDLRKPDYGPGVDYTVIYYAIVMLYAIGVAVRMVSG